jgi:four helix bundle protein
MSIAIILGMGVKRLEDLDAFNLAVEFKLAVYSLVRRHREAYSDLRWRSQLYEAAVAVESDIAEGWRRFRKREICQFFRYALASLEEAKRRLIDGVSRGHYSQASAEPVLVLGRRCGAATMGFMKSLGG